MKTDGVSAIEFITMRETKTNNYDYIKHCAEIMLHSLNYEDKKMAYDRICNMVDILKKEHNL